MQPKSPKSPARSLRTPRTQKHPGGVDTHRRSGNRPLAQGQGTLGHQLATFLIPNAAPCLPCLVPFWVPGFVWGFLCTQAAAEVVRFDIGRLMPFLVAGHATDAPTYASVALVKPETTLSYVSQSSATKSSSANKDPAKEQARHHFLSQQVSSSHMWLPYLMFWFFFFNPNVTSTACECESL